MVEHKESAADVRPGRKEHTASSKKGKPRMKENIVEKMKGLFKEWKIS